MHEQWPVSPEQRVVLQASWETYECLLAENVESCGTRLAYDEGLLEIMVVSLGHENPNRTLAKLAEIVAEETDRDFQPSGSTTFRRKDLKKGLEPDSSYYIDHAEAVRGKSEIDLMVDPPPDLVIEVDITRSWLNRFRILAAVGVPEVWRYDGERVTMHWLGEGLYIEIATSVVLPPLTANQATTFLQENRLLRSSAWLKRVHQWVRGQALWP